VLPVANGGTGNITTTASTQGALSASGVAGGYSLNVTTGLSAGTRGLQTLLQELVNRSHGHTLTYTANCNCGTCA
jgi:hypothetical protein